jgi:hypothetical protein
MKLFMQIIIAIAVLLAVVLLPVVPVSSAPVVLDATYTSRMVPLRQIAWFVINRPEGLSYQWHWYTFVVIAVLLAVGALVCLWALWSIWAVVKKQT